MSDKNHHAHIIVIGNEKGGTGKSTIAMHLAIKLLNEGFSVATIDFDGRQGSLSKYIQNRKNFCTQNNLHLGIPEHYIVKPSSDYSKIPDDLNRIHNLIMDIRNQYDAIIIDTPGNRNYLFEAAHQYADTLITPLSDSLVDLGAIADIDIATSRVKTPGHYADFVWEVKKSLASNGKSYLNWIVCGNKISPTRSRNREFVFSQLENIGKTYGFRFYHGLKDRVIYKELFLEGLTVLDMNQPGLNRRMSTSHLAAKIEIKNLAEFICP
ncbi:MAG: AAA family ATPase [Alphaproteobacteria bacterium]|nr:AAA family ATPase [Alphaproteobacteria bacterium]